MKTRPDSFSDDKIFKAFDIRRSFSMAEMQDGYNPMDKWFDSLGDGFERDLAICFYQRAQSRCNKPLTYTQEGFLALAQAIVLQVHEFEQMGMFDFFYPVWGNRYE